MRVLRGTDIRTLSGNGALSSYTPEFHGECSSEKWHECPRAGHAVGHGGSTSVSQVSAPVERTWRSGGAARVSARPTHRFPSSRMSDLTP